MKIKILFFVLMCSFFSRGQVSLVYDDFGSTATNPFLRTGWIANTASGSNWETRTTTPSTTYSWASPSASASGSANAFTNLSTNNNTKTLTYDNSLSTIGYTSIVVRIGGFKSGTVPNVDVSYSTDGVGYTSVGSITLNTSWTAHSVSLPTGAEGVANLRIRFSIVANSTATNFIRFDDFQVIGNNIPSSYSGVTAGAGAEPATISSVTNTLGASSLNFDFTVADDANTVAANDALPTLINQIIIAQGAGNDIGTWTQAIAGAQLTDGTNTSTATINATNITFSGINTATLGNIPDGTIKTYTVKIWLNTTLGGSLPTTIDGLNFAFKIDRTNFTTASVATSTQFESGAGTAIESGSTNNEVTVVTTKIVCTNAPGSTQYTNTNFTTLPIVKAQDANGNQDLNYASAVIITNSGSLGMSNAPTAFSAGTLTFPLNFQYTAAGNGTLTIAESPSAGITDAVTSAITVLNPISEINVKGNSTSIVDGDITPTTADFTTYLAAVVGSTATTRIYTIENLGTGPLSILSIVFSGANASSFALTTPPASTVSAGGTTTFTVTFTPNITGILSATLTINNDDGNGDETVYDFSIQGTGNASVASDLLYFAGSSPATISSTINDASPLSISTGVEVMRFLLRDGGTTTDADNLGTTLSGFTIAQFSNSASNWLQAIRTIELFDLTTNANVGIGVITTTDVTFSGLNISVGDGGSKTLALRMSLNCGMGSNSDNEYFGFSIANTTATFLSSGSQKSAFTAVRNTPAAGGTLKIAVVATKLSFTQQPTTTGINTAMTDVVVKATDACGNLDLGYTSSISLTSTGTMSGSPISVIAVAGVATFTGIMHTVIGTGYTLSTISALPVITSTAFNITTITVLKPGDLAILAVNTYADGIGSADEISFVCFQDILPGTTIYLTDNGYERKYAGLWGNTEGIISMTRNSSTLTKGTVVTIHTQDGGVNSGTKFTVYTCGSIDANWTKGVASSATSFFDLNKDDQVWITQGGTWGNIATTNHDATYNGNVLYGWTDIPWKTSPAWDLPNGTKGSTIYPTMDCFTTDVANVETGASQVKFNDPVNPDFSTTTNGKYDWIALINNPANWNYYATDVVFDSSGYDYLGSVACPMMTIATNIYVNGKWSGRKDINWFNCGNWDTLVVPDATVDVQIDDNTFNNQAKIDATASFASAYGSIAKVKNLTITGEKVELVADSNNKLEVHGNLLIDSPAGALDMDDSSAVTSDGQLYLYGNWTNNMGSVAFEEGNGTVQFVGTTPQVISNVTPEGTETFYSVLLDNNFDTAVSNNLRATGNLTINSGRTVSIDSNGYIQANKKLTHNGDLTIENNGQLVQVDETDSNDGIYTGTKFQVKRTAQVKHFDYVYWCSPTDNFPVASIPGTNRYEWDTLFANANGTQGYWVNPTTTAMTRGKGYIARASNGASTPQALTVTFTDKPHNGQFTFPINRGSYAGADYDADLGNATNAFTTKYDDNWNFVGNPYPSAIDAEEFLVLNQTKIEGSVWLWKHGFDPAATPSPFYTNYIYNYSTADLIKYNGLGSTEPDTFGGQIASGQGFLVNMLDTAPQPGSTITFNNSLRNGSIAANGLYNNSVFYRSNTKDATARGSEAKSRIWLDIINQSTGQMERTLVGYSTNSTLGKDHMYDCFHTLKTELSIYSLIEAKPFIIQGRPLPFDSNDMIPLGVKIVTAGTHAIAIKKVDGLFADEDQNIYLQDKELNIIHDLKQAPYTFNAQIGQFDSRFVLRYTNGFLSNDDFQSVDQNVVVVTNNNQIVIKSYSENISGIQVYDVLGREVFKNNVVNDAILVINGINPSQQVLLIKIKLVNGQTVTKKILF